MYGLIGGISVLVMIFAVSWNNDTNSSISDVIKNLAFGCVASTLVALLIEIGNTKEKNEKAKIAKDVSAGAVLIVAIASAIIGLIIFIPKL